MPTYEYACKSCGEHIEVVQAFTDDALTTCASCGGPLRKVFGTIGVVLKGSGFYRTDNRDGGPRSGDRDAKPAKKDGEKAGAAAGSSGSDRTGSDNSGSDKPGSDRSGSDRSGSDRAAKPAADTGSSGAAASTKSA